ncbi:unnamed protein product, partial [Dovyalis caffra]
FFIPNTQFCVTRASRPVPAPGTGPFNVCMATRSVSTEGSRACAPGVRKGSRADARPARAGAASRCDPAHGGWERGCPACVGAARGALARAGLE